MDLCCKWRRNFRWTLRRYHHAPPSLPPCPRRLLCFDFSLENWKVIKKNILDRVFCFLSLVLFSFNMNCRKLRRSRKTIRLATLRLARSEGGSSSGITNLSSSLKVSLLFVGRFCRAVRIQYWPRFMETCPVSLELLVKRQPFPRE